MDLEPPTFGDEEELDDTRTMAPAAKDDDKSFGTAQTSCFTRRPTSNKHVAFVETDDFSDYKSLRILKPPEQPTVGEDQDTTDGTADSDDVSDQSSAGTKMPEKNNNEKE